MLGSAACVQRGFFVMRGNYAKVVAALTPGSHQLVDWTAPNRYPEETLVRPGGLLVMRNSMYRFSDTAHRGSYDRIPVAKHDKGSRRRDRSRARQLPVAKARALMPPLSAPRLDQVTASQGAMTMSVFN